MKDLPLPPPRRAPKLPKDSQTAIRRMIQEYDEKPFDPEAPVARPAHHVYLNNPRRMRRNQRRPGIADDQTLHELLEMELETMGVEPRVARDISSLDAEIKKAARVYEDAVDAVLLDWIQRNMRKLNLSGNGPLEPDTDEFGVLSALETIGGGASFLYYMEFGGEGIGTWDGRWDKIFKNDNTIKELSDLIKTATYMPAQELNNALRNRAFELMQEHGLSMEENPRKKATKQHDEYYAQPYGIGASGFYFDSLEDFNKKFKAAAKRGVEEFELEFINGSNEDAQLFNSLGVSQATIDRWFEDIQPLDEHKKAGLYVLHAMMGENDIDKMLEMVEDDNPIVFEGNIKDYAYEYIEDTGSLDNAVQQIAKSREKLRDKKQYGEYEQFINQYFDYESYGRDFLINADEETANSYGDNEQEVGEQLVEELGWDGIGDENIKNYFDYDYFVRDLETNGDAREIEFAGKTFVFAGNR